MKPKIFTILTFILLQSCFSFKSVYPPIKYYYLQQEPFSFKSIAKIDVVLALEDFEFPYDILSTNQLQTKLPNNTVKRYFYHRWVESPNRLIMDFIIQRFNSVGAFFGVVKLSSSIFPNFILKGQVLDFSAYSGNEKSEDNYVSISIRVWVVKLSSISDQNRIVFDNKYETKQPRLNSQIESIAPAFSKALSVLVDKMIFDIQSALVEVDLR
ncbi:MAG: ABC-type transport auxiliary lipoprotein family protein [Candidatus Kapaibacteriales bacterium]